MLQLSGAGGGIGSTLLFVLLKPIQTSTRRRNMLGKYYSMYQQLNRQTLSISRARARHDSMPRSPAFCSIIIVGARSTLALCQCLRLTTASV